MKKPLLHIFVLFILIWSAISHAQRKGRRRGNPNSEKVIRNFDRSPLIPRPTNGLAGTARQTLDQLRQNGRSKTLQEAQNELNARKRPNKKYALKTQLVINYLREHTGPFTISKLRKHLKKHPRHPIHSHHPIEAALNELTFSKELTLIRPAINNWQTAVWAKTSELERMNKTSNQALDFYKKSGIIESSKIEQVIDYVRENTGPFTISELHKDHFSEFSSDVPIRMALNQLTSEGELKRHTSDLYRSHMWTKTSTKNPTQKEINEHFENSGLFKEIKMKQVIDIIESQEDLFTIPMIEQQLQHLLKSPSDSTVESSSSRSSSNVVIYKALNQLETANKVLLVQQGDRRNPNVWITRMALEKKGLATEEDIQRHFENSDLLMASKSKVEQIQIFVRTLETIFTVADIQKHFQKLSQTTTQEHSQKPSASTIHAALRGLTEAGELSLLKSNPGEAKTWIRTALLKEIEAFTQNLTSAFTISDIRNQFPKLSADQVYKILEQLTDQRKIKLVLQDEQLKWIRADLSSKQSFNQKKLKNPERSIEAISAEAKKIMSFIKNLTDPFTIPELKDQFPDLSTNQIYKALKELHLQNKIKLVLQDEQLKWVRVDLTSKQGTTQEKPESSKSLVKRTQTKMSRFHEGLRKARKAVQTMGEESKEVKVTGVKPLQDKLKNIKRSLRATERETKRLQGELESTKRSLETMESSVHQTQKEEELKNIKRLLEITKREIHQLQEEIKNIKELIQTEEQGISQVQKEPKNIQESMRKIEEKTNQVQEKLQDIRESVNKREQEINQLQEGPQIIKRLLEVAIKRFNQFWEELKNPGSSIEAEGAETKKIMSFITNLTGPFTIQELKDQFPDLSTNQIYKALMELTKQRQIKIILQNNQLKWIRALSSEQSSQEKPKDLTKPEEALSAEAEKILPFINTLLSPFDIPHIKNQFSRLSTNQIYKALMELTKQGKISFVLHKKQLKWVKTELLPEKDMTWEEVSKNRVEAWLIANSNIIMPFIEGTEKAFALPDIKQKFPNLSGMAIEAVLNKLISEGKIMLLQPGDENTSPLWIRTNIIHERGLTIKQAIEEYYEIPEKNLNSNPNRPPSLNNEDLMATNRPLNDLNPNLPENRGIAKVLFSLADSFTANFKLSEGTKIAFREIINTYAKLGNAFAALIEERNIILEEGGDPMSFFRPRDALSIVEHTASLKKVFESYPIDLENAVQSLTRFINDIISEGGRSSRGITEELNTWFNYWQRGESIFGQELQPY